MTPSSSDAWPLAARAVGSVLAGCRIEAVLHVGPVFTVYRAGDALGGGRYALKEYAPQSLCFRDAEGTPRLRDPSDPAAHAAFEAGRAACLEELRLLARLRLPGLVPVLQASEEQGCPCALMPLLPGGPLSRRDPPRGDETLRELLLSLLEPLSQVHAAGLVHGGLHVDQVLWAPGQRPVLLGFAYTARALRLPLALAQSAPELRPEGAHLPRGPWTDLFALAATVLQHATGRTWDGSATAADIAAALEAALPTPAGVLRPRLVQALHACLRPSPTERPDGALALRALVGGGSSAGQITAGRAASPGPAGVPPPLREAPGARPASPAAGPSPAVPPAGATTPPAFAFMSPALAVERLNPLGSGIAPGTGGGTARGAGAGRTDAPGTAHGASLGMGTAGAEGSARGVDAGLAGAPGMAHGASLGMGTAGAEGSARGVDAGPAGAPGMAYRASTGLAGADGMASGAAPGASANAHGQPAGATGMGGAAARAVPGASAKDGAAPAAAGAPAAEGTAGGGDGGFAWARPGDAAHGASAAAPGAGSSPDFPADAGLRAARPVSAPPRADGPSPRALAAGAAAALVLAAGVGLGAWWAHGLWQAEQEREHLGRLMAEAAAQVSASASAGGALSRAGAGMAEDGPGIEAVAGAGRGPQASSGSVGSTTGSGLPGTSGGSTASGAPGGSGTAVASALGLPRGATGQAATDATNTTSAAGVVGAVGGAAGSTGATGTAGGTGATAPSGSSSPVAGAHATAPGGDGHQAASAPARRAQVRREPEAGRGDTPAQAGAEADTLLASLPPTPLAACVSQAKSALERCMREQCAKDAWRSHALCRQPRDGVE